MEHPPAFQIQGKGRWVRPPTCSTHKFFHETQEAQDYSIWNEESSAHFPTTQCLADLFEHVLVLYFEWNTFFFFFFFRESNPHLTSHHLSQERNLKCGLWFAHNLVRHIPGLLYIYNVRTVFLSCWREVYCATLSSFQRFLNVRMSWEDPTQC